jgi:hypothetical protein
MKKQTVEIKELKTREVEIPIKGISPLLVHSFSEKKRKEILDRQNKKARNSKHESRDPESEMEDAKHKSQQGWEGFPAYGFKLSMIRAGKNLGLVMKDLYTSFFVEPDCYETDLIKIDGESELDERIEIVSNGAPDIRYRPIYNDWAAKLTITFNEGVVSLDQIYQMVHAAGWGVGIGEHRPEKKGGNLGRFRIDQ